MSEPLVSIIIPCQNSERYLRQTLNSCIRQTYRNIEIIIVNDASTDRTLDIANEFSSRCPQVQVIHQKKIGYCAARNVGFRKSAGQYVKYLDSDDLLLPHSIACQMDIVQDTGADIVVGGVQLFQGDRQSEAYRFINIPEKTGSFDRKTYKSIVHLFCEKAFTCNEMLIARYLVESVSGFDESLRSADEINFCYRLEMQNPGVVAMRDSQVVLLKRLRFDSNQFIEAANKEIPWELVSRLRVADLYLHGQSQLSLFQKEKLFDSIYQLSIYAYRDGKTSYALKGAEMWNKFKVPVPKFTPRYHYFLHVICGYLWAEKFLMFARKTFGRVEAKQ